MPRSEILHVPFVRHNMCERASTSMHLTQLGRIGMVEKRCSCLFQPYTICWLTIDGEGIRSCYRIHNCTSHNCACPGLTGIGLLSKRHAEIVAIERILRCQCHFDLFYIFAVVVVWMFYGSTRSGAAWFIPLVKFSMATGWRQTYQMRVCHVTLRMPNKIIPIFLDLGTAATIAMVAPVGPVIRGRRIKKLLIPRRMPVACCLGSRHLHWLFFVSSAFLVLRFL